MNDFTKEELIAITEELEGTIYTELRQKIQSMINNYCEHEPNIMSPEERERRVEITISEKPPLGIPPRHFWLKDRIRDCISALQRIEETSDWDLYLKQSLSLANEIKYAAEEWEEYYRENQ